jgi:hypothetical protein
MINTGSTGMKNIAFLEYINYIFTNLTTQRKSHGEAPHLRLGEDHSLRVTPCCKCTSIGDPMTPRVVSTLLVEVSEWYIYIIEMCLYLIIKKILTNIY